jgi:hypothetical protein
MSIKEHAKDVDVWIRGLFILVFGVLFYVLFWIILLLVLFQFVTKVITSKLNEQLMQFSNGLTQYAFQILNYMTFQSEVRPFPFSAWPGKEGSSDADPEVSSGASEISEPEKEDTSETTADDETAEK